MMLFSPKQTSPPSGFSTDLAGPKRQSAICLVSVRRASAEYSWGRVGATSETTATGAVSVLARRMVRILKKKSCSTLISCPIRGLVFLQLKPPRTNSQPGRRPPPHFSDPSHPLGRTPEGAEKELRRGVFLLRFAARGSAPADRGSGGPGQCPAPASRG